MNKDDALVFKCTFSKATTLIDGGWRVSFDLSEYDGDIVSKIAKLKDSILQIAILNNVESGAV
jgi:hypothetical protein